MIQEDLISVIVPVYNVIKYLDECVDSILHQTIQNIQIILVDDGSTDGSGERCEELKKQDSRIEVLHKANGGLSDARNAGIALATGGYITFVDSDDVIDKTYCEMLYESIKNRAADIAVCRT